MKKTLNRGFTLIELLVVIAIIGILASVVLASLNSARDKGEDAAIKSSINNARAQAAIYYEDNSNSYLGVCAASQSATPGGILDLVAGAIGGGATVAACDDEDTAWAVEKELNSGEFYCVDSTGKAAENAATKGAGVTGC